MAEVETARWRAPFKWDSALGKNRKRCQEAEEGAEEGRRKRARCTLASARVFFYSEKARIKSYIPSSILSYLPDSPGAREDTGWERRRGGSPIPEGRSLKRMALSASFSSSLRLLCLASLFSLFAVFQFLSLSVSFFFSFLSFSLPFYPWPSNVPFLPSLSDFQPRFFLRFFLELRLPRIRQDYLSSAKGRSRLNLKHHLNKREVTARLFPAGKSGRETETL